MTGPVEVPAGEPGVHGPSATKSDAVVASRRRAGVKSDRRKEITAAAARVFADKGFEAATVRDIADESGILSGSLYYYFQSKEAMLEAVLEPALRALVENYQSELVPGRDWETTFHLLMQHGVRFAVEWPDEARILSTEWMHVRQSLETVPAHYSTIREVWKQFFRDGIERGIVRPDLDPEITYRTIMGAVQSIARWFNRKGRFDIDEVARQQSQLYLSGMAMPGRAPISSRRSVKRTDVN